MLKWNQLSRFHIKVYRGVIFFFFFLIFFLPHPSQPCVFVWGEVDKQRLRKASKFRSIRGALIGDLCTSCWCCVDTFCQCVAGFPYTASSLSSVNQCEGARRCQRSSLWKESRHTFADSPFTVLSFRDVAGYKKLCQWKDIKASALYCIHLMYCLRWEAPNTQRTIHNAGRVIIHWHTCSDGRWLRTASF